MYVPLFACDEPFAQVAAAVELIAQTVGKVLRAAVSPSVDEMIATPLPGVTSPNTPALLNSILPVEPLVMVVAPT